ncbi:MAG: D-aminoacyl-tRNA deacylase [Bifidobacterium sp.]|nr:D-aminoacyl-tRNA deacylase [Bifidobacterium sp.]
MRVILQKVSRAEVAVADDPTFIPQRIGIGYMLLVGLEEGDTAARGEWIARKIAKLRVFEDADGKMNLSIADVQGEVLSVSQFTLYGDVRRGNRPGFTRAMEPVGAKALWLKFDEALRAQGLTVREGRFGAHMQVELVNDGPVTIVFDSDELGLD